MKRTSHAAEPHIRSHRDNKDIHTCAADLQPLLLDVSSGRPSEAVRSSSPLIVQLLSTLLFLVSPDVQALCFSSFPFAVEVSRSVVLAVMLFVRLSMRDTRAHSSRIIYISPSVKEGITRIPTTGAHRSTLVHLDYGDVCVYRGPN